MDAITIVKGSVGKSIENTITKEKVMVMGVGVVKEGNRETLTIHVSNQGKIESYNFTDFCIKHDLFSVNA